MTFFESKALFKHLEQEEIMSFLFGVIALILGALSIYLFMLDADVIGQVAAGFQLLLNAIDAGNMPFSKGVIIGALGVAFAVLAIIMAKPKKAPTP